MTTPFPLFSLPFIPLKQVLDNFGPNGIIFLSLCSQRSKSVAVSYSGPSKDVQLMLEFGPGLESLDVSNTNALLRLEKAANIPTDEILESVRIGSFEKVPVKIVQGIMRREHLITYWEDRITGVAAIGDYGREIFNRDIYEVRIGEKEAEDDHRRAAEWVKSSQETIQSLSCNF